MQSIYIPKIWVEFKEDRVKEIIETATNVDNIFLFAKVKRIDFQPTNNAFRSCFIHFEEPISEYAANAIKNDTLVVRCYYDNLPAGEMVGVHRLFIKENLSDIPAIHQEIAQMKQRLENLEKILQRDDWEIIKN
jgi:hypothetical protein